MVKGLAKPESRRRHGLRTKYVDAGISARGGSGYSPMTRAVYPGRQDSSTRLRGLRLSDWWLSAGPAAP